MVNASDTSQPPEIKMQDNGIRWFGYLVILILFGGLGGWSAYAMIDSAAMAPGLVTVESYRKAVQHLEGGIVQELTVREGDTVQAGDIVARLDDTQFSSQLEAVRSQLAALRALEARLIAERDGLDEVVLPPTLIQTTETVVVDPRVNEFISVQRQVFEARRADLTGRIEVLEQRIEQLQEQVTGLDARERSLVRRIDLYNDELSGLRSLFDEGMGDKIRLRALDRDLAEVEGELAAVRSDRNRARLQIAETRLQIAQTQREAHRDVVTELSAVQERLFEALEQARGLEDRVRRTAVRAPATGRVVGLDVHTVGGVLAPGERLMDIVPQDEPLVIDARVLPQDIDRVFAGLEAQVRFTAFNFRTTPTVTGRVMTLSADSLTDPQTGMSYFLARVEVSDSERQKLGEVVLLPGMPAEVMIITGERTLLDYIMRPLSDALARSFRED